MSLRFFPRLVFLFLIIISLWSQASFNVGRFIEEYPAIISNLPLTDLERYETVLNGTFNAIRIIHSMADDRFFFAPVFEETPGAEQNNVAWWYFYVVLRYFCYPKKILALHGAMFDHKREVYLERFIKGRTTYAQLDWIQNEKIKHVILYRYGKIFIEPVTIRIVI